MKAESRAALWLAIMLAFGILMALVWANMGGQIVNQIARLLSF